MSGVPATKACVTGCDRKFFTGAQAMLRTARRFHPDVTRYLLTGPGDVEFLQDTLGDLARVLPFPRSIRGVPEAYLSSYSRLFVPDLLTEDVVAWVDSDAIFVDSADRLWDVSAGRVHAAPNLAYPLWPIGMWLPAENWEKYASLFPGVRPDDAGFNAGVFALRPADWTGLLARFEQAVAAVGFTQMPFVTDQTMLNGFFLGRVDYLPPQYNFHCFLDPSARQLPGVKLYHYAGVPKPWDASYPRLHPAYYFWEKFVLGRSPLRLAARQFLIRSLGTPRNYVLRAVRRIKRAFRLRTTIE